MQDSKWNILGNSWEFLLVACCRNRVLECLFSWSKLHIKMFPTFRFCIRFSQKTAKCLIQFCCSFSFCLCVFNFFFFSEKCFDFCCSCFDSRIEFVCLCTIYTYDKFLNDFVVFGLLVFLLILFFSARKINTLKNKWKRNWKIRK